MAEETFIRKPVNMNGMRMFDGGIDVTCYLIVIASCNRRKLCPELRVPQRK